MISEAELVGRIARLQPDTLAQWIALRWVSPGKGETGYLFEDADVARVHLICDLRYDLEIEEDSIPVILALIDQVHDARRTLRALASAVGEQPETVRAAVVSRARHLLFERD
jgi:chaperone modulatory protein CbpM